MKTINVTFTDKEHDELTLRKDRSSWRSFILSRAGVTEEGEQQ
jgi:hypothetical protein